MIDNTKIAREYAEKYQNMPTRTLAKLMHKEKPKTWCTLKSAYSCISNIRGLNGYKSRSECADKTFFKLPSPTPSNPFSLPESDVIELRPYILTSSKVLVMADLHIPYHDIKAITTALRYAENANVDSIVLDGDIIDCYALSRFDQDKNMRDFSGELNCARQFFATLRKHFPKAKIILRQGNHEYRFERYLMHNAPSLIGVDEFDLKVLLRTFDYGIEFVKDKRIIRFGKLNILHGDEFNGGTGSVNPARSMFLKTFECTLSGHNHRTSSHAEASLDGKQIGNWSIGCLCGLRPQYMPYNKWNHGFAIVERHGSDNFSVQNHIIIDGKVY